MKKRKILLTAGGTGGHLFPAQAVAEAFPEDELLFVGGGLSRNRFFDRDRFPYREIATATFRLTRPWTAVKALPVILRGIWQSRRILRHFSPDLVIGFGSFYTFPLLVAAWLSRVPLLLHEQNSLPGKVNRWFSRVARATAITFPESAPYLSGRSYVVPFPIRTSSKEDPWSYFGLERGRETLLVFGGSQGAHRLNTLLVSLLPQLARISHTPSEEIAALPREVGSQRGEDSVLVTRTPFSESQILRAECASSQRECEKYGLGDYQLLHFTGREDEAEVRKAYQKSGVRHCVKSFEPKMHLAMACADLAITRAGAATLAELAAHELPAILIPFPYAAENHQEKNAAAFVGGEVYREAELTPERLLEAILSFPKEEKRDSMRMQKRASRNKTLADLIEEMIDHG